MMKLLERDSYLDQLERTLQAVMAGQGHVVLVSGEAGIGKTSLVDQFTTAHRGFSDRSNMVFDEHCIVL